MCLGAKTPSVPEPTPAPEPPVQERQASPEMQAAIAEQRRKAALRTGQMGTVLTGPQGLTALGNIT